MFASKYGIRNLVYSLAGERENEIELMNLPPKERLEKDVDFAGKFSYDIPPMNLYVKDFPEDILLALGEAPDNKIENMMELNKKLELLRKMNENEKINKWRKHLECMMAKLAR